MATDDDVKERLRALQSTYGAFRVAHHGAWNSDWRYTMSDNITPESLIVPNHRAIVPGEVVWDYDEDSKADNQRAAYHTLQSLTKDGVIGGMWDTRGRGYHVHAFFNPDSFATYKREKKHVILDHYAYPGAKIDLGKIGNTLIRMEYAITEHGEYRKQFLLGTRDVVINAVPRWVGPQVQLLVAQQPILTPITPGKTPDCLEAFRSRAFYDLHDGKKRSLFYIAATLVESLPYEEAFSWLVDWNNHLDQQFSHQELRAKLKYVGGKRRRMSCKARHEFLRELGVSFQCCNDSFISAQSRKESSKDEVSSCDEKQPTVISK